MASLTRYVAKSVSPNLRLLPGRTGALVRHNSGSALLNRASPPPLPPREQKEWEELIRRAERPASSVSQVEKEAELQLHPDARRPLQPDFEGDTNPKTGEIGGPKKDPLNWGPTGEWTYGGRATDF